MCLQRYIWWKKSIDVWTKDHPFPIDIDYMISDTLELLRPKMRLSCSLDEATKQVTDLEREVLVKLGRNTVVYIRHVITTCVKDVSVCAAAGLVVPAEQHSQMCRRTTVLHHSSLCVICQTGLAHRNTHIPNTHSHSNGPVSQESLGMIIMN